MSIPVLLTIMYLGYRLNWIARVSSMMHSLSKLSAKFEPVYCWYWDYTFFERLVACIFILTSSSTKSTGFPLDISKSLCLKNYSEKSNSVNYSFFFLKPPMILSKSSLSSLSNILYFNNDCNFFVITVLIPCLFSALLS